MSSAKKKRQGGREGGAAYLGDVVGKEVGQDENGLSMPCTGSTQIFGIPGAAMKVLETVLVPRVLQECAEPVLG
jgi:hypothetical protein